ncbi:uncharacterized protein LOC129911591 [Episyrphus balteatus]|uniref:uncharacterized protein LOC129911591 n=1 Tax=Episyrphus balteatus TaxID=286459 RepID=UPI002484DC0D|nr:uncharacterized protein LOC129911591 [Episyrphus balteatus]
MNLELLLSHLLTLQSNAAVISNDLNRRILLYRKKRQQCLLNILRAYNKKQALLKTKRIVWTKTRTSKFWEEDIPKNDDQFFKENFRTTRENFEILCFHLRNLKKNDTQFRKSIPLPKRIAIALYTLGSSAEYRSVANLFGVGKCTVGNILHEFCEEVWKVLHPIYLSAYPLTEDKIKENVEGFSKLGFPQCFGAIDGCHIEIRPAAENAIDYYNYKGWYSTVLLAVVDYRYRFLYISVGSPGRCNDSSIFENSSLKVHHQDPILKAMSKNLCDVNVPVVLIGDSAFRFSDILMKPYPYSTSLTPRQKNFNFHLSKSRRVVENAFGHLKARFRRIGKGLDNHIENTNLIIKSCCVLHNFLNSHSDEINSQWLQRSTEATTREQPEFNSIINDTNPTANNIRNAISNYLGTLHP